METEEERRKRIWMSLPLEVRQQLEKEWKEILERRMKQEEEVVAAYKATHKFTGLDGEWPELSELKRNSQREFKAFLKKRDDLMEEQARILDLKEKD